VEPGTVPAEAVRPQLERLLASSGFRSSERLNRFLKFVVQQRLAGNASQIKESVLAVEIFDRDPSYDSRVDSVVRVEARRVRDKLEKYYRDEGRDDPVVISLPKGTYVPEFSLRTEPVPPAAPPGPIADASSGHTRTVPLLFVIAAASAFILITFAAAYWMWSHGRGTAAPLRRLTSDSGLTFQPALSADGTLLAYSSDRSGSGDFDIWVQRTSGGLPHRLTEDPRDEIEPAFSPDGTVIAYRAEGPADGIYTVPSLGGQSTLLARGGYRPRFSPDGARIAYWMGERTFRAGKIFVVPTTSGKPVQLVPEFLYAAYPVWSPDGRYIAFVGCQAADNDLDRALGENWDWWVVPSGGGPAVRTHAHDALGRQGLSPPESTLTYRRIAPYAWTSSGDVIFSAESGDKTNIWRIPISARTGQVHGPAEQLTFGAGREDHPTVAKDGTLAFAVLTYKSDVWSLPTNRETGESRGPLTKLTSSSANHKRPVVSRDGQRVAFLSNRNGNYDVWVKDLASGDERALTATRENESAAVLSPDGSTVAITSNNFRFPILLVPFAGGRATQLRSAGGEPRTWFPDGRALLYQWRTPAGFSAISTLTLSGETQVLVQSRESALYSPSVSPDGKWLALIVRTPPSDHRVALVPLNGKTAAPPSQWVYVTESGPWINKPRWAPRGNLIYFASDRDGFECIWARYLDPATKQPIGEPKAIIHFHSVHNSLGSVYDAELSVANDKLVFNLGEASGNIWIAPAAN
jgi:Tol biopolymer transport system component